MPRKKKKTHRGFDVELLDQLLAGKKTQEEIFGADGVVTKLAAAIAERALEAEMAHHLGYDKGKSRPEGLENARNGHSKKTVKTDRGDMTVSIPRDREAEFEPLLIPKHTRRLAGFDEKVLSLYARGMTLRDVQSHLEELYGTHVSPELLSKVTDAVLDEMNAWRKRGLEKMYPVVYFDCIFIKMRHNGIVSSRAVYVALAITAEGQKDILGLWMAETEGAKFWLSVFNDLKNRGVEDILIACCDGLKGLPQALEAAFPHVIVQTCVVHQIRSSLRQVAWGERKEVAAALKPVYTAVNEEAALEALAEFDAQWGSAYPMITRSWENNWERIMPFFGFPPEIRKVIYTTNPIEGLNRQLRKVVKTRGAFPSEQAVYKVLYLAIRRITKKWNYPVKNWKRAMQQFAIYFPNRVQI